MTVKSLPKVSIMIITYNHRDFIHETLTSTLEQDYENLEVVVADDGSNDGTIEIIQDYAHRYPTRLIPLVGGPNLGITGNSNRALSACTGDYVAIMGGDDILLPGKITQQIAKFKKNPSAVLCYHPVEIFESKTNKTLMFTDMHPAQQLRSAEDIIINGGIPGACSVMVKRSAIPLSGFDPKIPAVSDWLFFIEVALQGTVIKLNGVYARYRKHMDGASQRTYELLEETLYVLDIIAHKNPNNLQLKNACSQGKARYIAGEAFRQIGKNSVLAEQLAVRALSFSPHDKRYKCLYYICKALKFAPLRIVIVPMLMKLKFFLKKRI